MKGSCLKVGVWEREINWRWPGQGSRTTKYAEADSF